MKRYGLAAAKAQTVFTTHTPVEAGHDMFDYTKIHGMLGSYLDGIDLAALGGHDRLNMTRLALNLSRSANAVSKRHGIVSRQMFPDYKIDSITNGVHSRTWTSKVWKKLYDEYFNGLYYDTNWRADPLLLDDIDRIPDDEVCAAHVVAKRNLLHYIELTTGEVLD